MQNPLVKSITGKFQQKTKLKPLYEQLKFLKVEQIFNLEVAKFMRKLHRNQLPSIFHILREFFLSTRTLLEMRC